MVSHDERWVLADIEHALAWCLNQNSQDLCCTLAPLGEDIKTEQGVLNSIESYLTCAHELQNRDLDGAVGVKLTSLGALFNKKFAQENLLKIFKATEQLNVNIEFDIEGASLVDFTIETALQFSDLGYHVTLALQAYLNRTPIDIKRALDHDVTVRLVKGAYIGDTNDFIEIQNRFKKLVKILVVNEKHFSIGTHDPELIKWVKENYNEHKDIIEFGFLKGLADTTKLRLSKAGWAVAEYVPYGLDSKAYVMRRSRYLKELEHLGRSPVD